MLKFVLKVILISLVPISGLVSCGPDKKPAPDVFLGKTPKVQKISGETLALTQEMASGLITLDLRDSFDLSDSQPSRVKVTSTCKVGDKSISFSGEALATSIRVFQTISPSVLAHDFKKENIQCLFEVGQYNASGSGKISIYPMVQISDEQDSPITIEKNGETQDSLVAGQIDGVNVRYDSETKMETHLTCQDVDFEPAIFHSKIIGLSAFNFARRIPQDPEDPYAYKARHYQSCRILLGTKSKVQEVSRAFSILFPYQTLNVTVVPSDHNPAIPVPFGGSFEMYRLRFTNSEPIARTVRYIARRYNSNIQIYGNANGLISLAPRQYISVGFVSWFDSNGATAEFSVPANGSLDVPISFYYAHAPRCHHGSQGHTVQPAEGFVFTPLYLDGREEAPLELGDLPAAWSWQKPGMNPGTFKPAPNTGKDCFWD